MASGEQADHLRKAAVAIRTGRLASALRTIKVVVSMSVHVSSSLCLRGNTGKPIDPGPNESLSQMGYLYDMCNMYLYSIPAIFQHKYSGVRYGSPSVIFPVINRPEEVNCCPALQGTCSFCGPNHLTIAMV